MTDKKIKATQTELNISKEKKLITLQGYTTSQINQALKADNPYPARVFLKVDNQEKELPSNLNSFNKGLDIPVFFRIKCSGNFCPGEKECDRF